MNITRCANGHFYDRDLYGRCPHCSAEGYGVTQRALNSVAPAVPVNVYDDVNISGRGVGRLPEELSDCTIVGTLGSGGVGQVYKLEKTAYYAVKVVPWVSEGFRFLAKHEYETARLFDGCENTIHYLGFYESDQKSFLLQELAEPWIDYYNKNPITVGDVLYAVLSACEALQVIHAQGYQHFDINPRNIFIQDGIIKLGDFSHSFKIKPGDPFKHRLGTSEFMAPEIFREGICSGKEDIYSLGITMYALLTGGELPFDYTGRKPRVREKSDTISTLFLHPEIIAIISKACAYDPRERYQSVDDIISGLDAFGEEHMDQLDEVLPSKKRRSSSGQEGWVHNSTQVTMGVYIDTSEETTTVLDDNTPSTQAQPSPPFVTEKAIRTDEVQFGAVMESSAERDGFGVIDIGMYTELYREKALEEMKAEFSGETKTVMSGIMEVESASEVTIILSGSDVEISESSMTQRWNGKYLKFSFDFYVPEEYRKKKILFKADVYFDGIIATSLKFTVDVAQTKETIPAIERKDVLSAFVSYAREDISAVTYIIQALKKARPDMDVFFDLETLRSGDEWEKRLYSEILKRDKLFLCWSHFAAQSEWVKKEWTYMMENKGIDAIEPIPLEDPYVCPAPEKLKGLHFNDIEIMIRNAYGSGYRTKRQG